MDHEIIKIDLVKSMTVYHFLKTGDFGFNRLCYMTENSIQLRAFDIIHFYLVTLDLLDINCKIKITRKKIAFQLFQSSDKLIFFINYMTLSIMCNL